MRFGPRVTGAAAAAVTRGDRGAREQARIGELLLDVPVRASELERVRRRRGRPRARTSLPRACGSGHSRSAAAAIRSCIACDEARGIGAVRGVLRDRAAHEQVVDLIEALQQRRRRGRLVLRASTRRRARRARRRRRDRRRGSPRSIVAAPRLVAALDRELGERALRPRAQARIRGRVGDRGGEPAICTVRRRLRSRRAARGRLPTISGCGEVLERGAARARRGVVGGHGRDDRAGEVRLRVVGADRDQADRGRCAPP